MNPIVVITLILLGIGGAYFLLINLGAAQVEAGSAPNEMLTNYGALAAKILIGVMVLYGIYYVVDVIKTALKKRT